MFDPEKFMNNVKDDVMESISLCMDNYGEVVYPSKDPDFKKCIDEAFETYERAISHAKE